MNNLELQRKNLKSIYDKTIEKYETALIRDFDCDYDKCNMLDLFF